LFGQCDGRDSSLACKVDVVKPIAQGGQEPVFRQRNTADLLWQHPGLTLPLGPSGTADAPLQSVDPIERSLLGIPEGALAELAPSRPEEVDVDAPGHPKNGAQPAASIMSGTPTTQA